MLNPKELEVLQIIARSETPLGLPDILAQNPAMVKSTVAAALAKLLKEELIEVGGIGRSGKVICRTYLPTERTKEILLGTLTTAYSQISDIISASDLCVCLLRMNKDTQKAKEELTQLRAMLDEYEKETGL